MKKIAFTNKLNSVREELKNLKFLYRKQKKVFFSVFKQMFNLSLVYNVEVYASRQISEGKLFL
jgi:hypothetical protein